jgi:hypothetical protein
MDEKQKFDFWYAVENTTVIKTPQRHLETFGQTLVRYHLISELMDSVNKIRVREGSIMAFRPQIITPDSFVDNMLEGFDGESAEYMNWLKKNNPDLFILKYGFSIKNQETNDHIISNSLKHVVEKVELAVENKNDPNTAILVGVDKPWEVCLLKLMVEIVQTSATGNYNDIKQQRNILSGRQSQAEIAQEIEDEFRLASKNAARIEQLGRLLEKHGLFEKYQDRFFSIVQSR